MLHLRVMLIYSSILSSLLVSGTTDKKLRKEFLERNNAVRRAILTCSLKYQPPAQKLPLLVWNDKLAQTAQKWVDTCALKLDSQKNRSLPNWKWVGQNWAAALSIKAAFDHWQKGYLSYNFTDKSCSAKSCGEYTQMVWAKTSAVGCGIKNCTAKKGFPTTYSIACNYGPGGNIVGQSPYVAGTKKNCIAPAAKAMKSQITVEQRSVASTWSYSHVLLITCQLVGTMAITHLCTGTSVF